MKRIGVISDTHGQLRPEVIKRLDGSDLIIHAGDVGADGIIGRLEQIAPVKVVRGNVDYGAWASKFPLTEALELEGVAIFIYHGHLDLDIDPVKGGFKVIISGHSHIPKLEEKEGILYLNPGSCGPKRFSRPVSMARLELADGNARAELIPLE
ncbi:MAG: metallophosphoesterase family protein [Trueperaceae bacterium]|nr:metallophosphoesterase family protein [Trueperaceae bacterium]